MRYTYDVRRHSTVSVAEHVSLQTGLPSAQRESTLGPFDLEVFEMDLLTAAMIRNPLDMHLYARQSA